MSDWTRRHFLHRAMLGSAGVLCATSGARVAHAKMAPDVPEMRFARRLFPEGDPTTVRMVGFDPEVAFGEFEAYREVMAAALETPAAQRLATRIRADVDAGKRVCVLVKPAVNTGNKYPYTSSPYSVQGVCEWLDGLGVQDIAVADKSGWAGNAAKNMRRNGLEAGALEGGAHRVLAFDDLPAERRWETYRIPEASNFKNGMELTALLSEAHYVINVARAATHKMARITLSLKNWQGITSMRTRGHSHLNLGVSLTDAMAEYALAVKPDLVVMDAGEVCSTYGPDFGLVIPAGVLLVGEDMVATDLATLGVMRHCCMKLDKRVRRHARVKYLEREEESPWNAPTIRHAVKLKVGAFEREQVLLDPVGVDGDLLSTVERSLAT
jgi:uncharacterized protein (DUF362 family)